MNENDNSIRLDYDRYYGNTHFPVAGNFDIIKMTDNIKFNSVLDVGFGMGGASVYFSEKGKVVTALGRDLGNYDFPRDVFKQHGIRALDVWVENFKAEEPFDAIWASHVVEHTANISIALQTFRTLLKEDGWLFICVPPHKTKIVSGHISMGWSVVQLMLILYFNGFCVKTGHFASHKYNIVAFVQKESQPRFSPADGGIIPLHDIADDFPINLHPEMDGQIPAVNWFEEVGHRPLIKPIEELESAIKTIKELRQEAAQLKTDLTDTRSAITSTMEQALLNSQSQLADALQPSDANIIKPRLRNNLDAEYYQRIHDSDEQFQKNNWLLSEIDKIMAADPKAIVEIGCGNGDFVKAIAQHVNHVTAVDWAKSPLLDPLPDNAAFLQADILIDELPTSDLICSADLLEHFEPDEIAPLLTKMKISAPLQYHVISCYDDGHSHLTIMPPGAWLATFRQFDKNFRLTHVDIRRNDPRQVVCTITNIAH